MTSKNTICLWYDTAALEAATFYAATFPDSKVGTVYRAPGDYPSGKQGDVLTVEFTVMGIPCLGLNGGPAFKHSEAFSFQVATGDQAETDRLWAAIVGNGGQESACRFGSARISLWCNNDVVASIRLGGQVAAEVINRLWIPTGAVVVDDDGKSYIAGIGCWNPYAICPVQALKGQLIIHGTLARRYRLGARGRSTCRTR